MGLLCCFRPGASLTVQHRGSEEGPNLCEVDVPEPAQSIAAGHLTNNLQITRATSAETHVEVGGCRGQLHPSTTNG